MAFDPDAYLAKKQSREGAAPATSGGFDPDAYLKKLGIEVPAPEPGFFQKLFGSKPSAPAAPTEGSGLVSPEEMLTPIAEPAAVPTAAKAEPPPYKSKLEALDDAVNLLEEGYGLDQVIGAFGNLGISKDEITAHGVKRRSEYFAPQKIKAAEPTPVEPGRPAGEMRGMDTTLYEDITGIGKRSAARGRQAIAGLLKEAGVYDEDELARITANEERKIQAARPSMSVQEGMENIGNAKTMSEAAYQLAANPAATFTMLAESLLMTAPALAAVVTGGGIPMGAAIGTYSGSLEYGSSLAETLANNNIDPMNAYAVGRALRDPKFIEELRERGLKRGLTIGAIDGLTAGFAGKFIAPVMREISAGKLAGQKARNATIGAWAKETSMQVAGGGGGEALAQALTGEYKPADILLEAAAEGITAPLEARGAVREARKLQAGAPPVPTVPPTVTPPAPPAAAPEPRIEPTLGPAADLQGKVEASVKKVPSGMPETREEALDLLNRLAAATGQKADQQDIDEFIKLWEQARADQGLTPIEELADSGRAIDREAKAEAPDTQTYIQKMLPVEVPVSDLKLSKDVPQFKSDANEQGVVERLGGKFEREGLAPIQVWRRLNGDLEVISGRHRLDLARRSGEQTIPAQVFNESDGFDAKRAAIMDAELNIRDEKGKVKDYVTYFKETKLPQDEAESRGLLARSVGKRAYTIANEGSEELITALRNEAVTDEGAFVIAKNAPNDARLQAVGLQAIQKGLGIGAAANKMQALKALAGEADTSIDMFGFDTGALKEAEEMGKIADRKQREIGTRLAAISGAAKNPKLAKQEGIDIRDEAAVARRVDELRQLKAAWDNWPTNADLREEIRAEMRPTEARAAKPTKEEQAAINRQRQAEQRKAAEESKAAQEREEKAIADREVELFKLQPSVTELEMPAAADLFGAIGLTEQPPKRPTILDEAQKPTGLFAPPETFDERYVRDLPVVKAGDMVDNYIVRKNVPNMGSISASLDDYEILDGIRQVPFGSFEVQGKPEYSSSTERSSTKDLADQIKQSGEINPLIVVQDEKGLYILEGGHRFDALRELGAKSFPAVVVVDQSESSTQKAVKEETQHLETVVKDTMEALGNDFMVGDEVRVGNSPGVVVGIEGDYLRVHPDRSDNPKAYRRIQKNLVTFVARPDTKSQVALSTQEDQDKKFGVQKGRLNADMGGLIQLLGANMYASNVADVAVKELLQNAFDAVKGAISSKKEPSLYKTGEIEIFIDADKRTITVQDNARGMTPQIVQDAFFTVAGSDKSDLDPKDRSGGLGLAKMGFMLGSKRLQLKTIRDGVKVTVDTTAKDIANSNFEIKKSPAPKGEHGTKVTVQIPDKYVDPRTGEEKPIWFPWGIDHVDPLKQPLVGPASVKLEFKKYDKTEKKTLPVGTNFPNEKYQIFKVNFDWGTADVYVSLDRKDRPSHKVLSSGVYQFENRFMLSQDEQIPYDIVVDIKSNVEAKHPDYPFENSRERFKGRLEKDVNALTAYLQRVARGNEMAGMQETFKNIVSLPRIEVGKETAETAKKLKKAFDKGVPQEKFELPPLPSEVRVTGDLVVDLRGEVLADVSKEAEKKKEATFEAEVEAPTREKFMLDIPQDPRNPIFHNNTNVDYIEAGQKYGNPEVFFGELGTLFIEMKEALAKSKLYGYDKLSPENLFYAGIGVDRKYAGVHIKVPYKAVLVNPFYDWGAKTLFGVRQNLYETMIHEIAHTGSMDHGVAFLNQMTKVEQFLADEGLEDYFRDAILNILVRHESVYTAMREAYGKSTTSNVGKSLEEYEQSKSAAASRRVEPSGEGEERAAAAGERPERDEGIRARSERDQELEVGGRGAPEAKGPIGPVRKNIFGGPAPNPAWGRPDDRKTDDGIFVLQDKMIDTKRVIEEIEKVAGRINERWDAYLQEELYHGRTAKKTNDFLNDELTPLLKDMQKRGVTLLELEEFLHNKHAEERNIQVAKVNPNMPDKGSGITTQDAQDYLDALPANKKRNLEALAKRVRDIVTQTQNVLLDSGLETPQTINAWNNTYKNYVPLMREEADYETANIGRGVGQGFSVKGPSSKRATGSSRKVIDILANVAIQREKAIVRAEKTRVSQAVYGLAVQYPNTDFWLAIDPKAITSPKQAVTDLVAMGLNPADAANIIAEPVSRTVDPVTNQVVERINPILRTAENVLAVRVNGADKFVFFNTQDPRALRMVQALKNLDADQLSRGMSIIGRVTRYFASVNTQYNPIFGIINFTRDVQGALLNLTTTPIADKAKQIYADTLPALRGIYADIRSRRKGMGAKTGTWAQLWEEFQREGGQTGFRDQFSRSEERADALAKTLAQLSEGNFKKGARAIFDWLSDYNETLENAVRLAAYKAAKDKGLSNAQAASIAKNLTVNFNRKGQIGRQMGALYAFFNASTQGTARMYKTLTGPAGKKIMYGGLLLGSAQALLLAAAGFDEDQPSDFVKEKNLVIPLFREGKYINIPMPLGFNVIPNTGRVLTEWALSGFKNTSKRVVQITGAVLDAFNPIGNAGWSFQTFAPTVADPAVALFENKDWTGKPIARKDISSLDPTPGYTRAKDTASWFSKQLSYLLNIATGGTKYQPGIISPTPDQIDYLIGQATGGVGREVMKVEQTVTSGFTGEELPSYKIPLAGRFYGSVQEASGVRDKFYKNIEMLNRHENEIQGRRKNRENVQEYLQEHPEARLFQQANVIERDIQKLRKYKDQLKKRDASKEEIQRIDEQITRRMKSLNDRVQSARP